MFLKGHLFNPAPLPPCVSYSTCVCVCVCVVLQGSDLFLSDEERLAVEARRQLDRQELMQQKRMALETNKIVKEQQEKEKQ